VKTFRKSLTIFLGRGGEKKKEEGKINRCWVFFRLREKKRNKKKGKKGVLFNLHLTPSPSFPLYLDRS